MRRNFLGVWFFLSARRPVQTPPSPLLPAVHLSVPSATCDIPRPAVWAWALKLEWDDGVLDPTVAQEQGWNLQTKDKVGGKKWQNENWKA